MHNGLARAIIQVIANMFGGSKTIYMAYYYNN